MRQRERTGVTTPHTGKPEEPVGHVHGCALPPASAGSGGLPEAAIIARPAAAPPAVTPSSPLPIMARRAFFRRFAIGSPPNRERFSPALPLPASRHAMVICLLAACVILPRAEARSQDPAMPAATQDRPAPEATISPSGVPQAQAEAQTQAQAQTADNASAPVIIPPLPVLSDEKAREEAARLTRSMKRKVARFSTYTPEIRQRFIRLAHAMIARTGTPIDRPQLLMVVDRNPRVQRLSFVLALPGTASWEALGGTPVSTGRAGRKYYYITPVGVFPNTTDRLGYRALGTKNRNGIRGIGAKGMRVWDMGWHNAVKGWRADHETGDIRLEIHATDPDFLEQRLGHPASEGCIRIPASLNVFMDRNGLLDVQYEQAASYDGRFRALLPKDRTPTPIAGDLLVVVDSAEPVQAVTAAAAPPHAGPAGPAG
nr:L,D-transpeptidase [Swaminathania salitolerans]